MPSPNPPTNLSSLRDQVENHLMWRSYAVIAGTFIGVMTYIGWGMTRGMPLWTIWLAFGVWLANGIYRIDLQLRVGRTPKPEQYRSPNLYR